MIVHATTPADVQRAVRTARAKGLPVTVHATGHGGPLPPGDLVVVTTARMAGVRVDPERRTARVGAGSGGVRSSPLRRSTDSRRCPGPHRTSAWSATPSAVA